MRSVVLLLVALFMFGCGEVDSSDNIGVKQFGPEAVDPVEPVKPVGPIGVVEPLRPEIVEKDKYEGPFTKIERATIKWEVSTSCGNQHPGTPTLVFYDKQSGEILGPYTLAAAKQNIDIWCRKGNEICWGAWLGKGNYYDCSKADETGYCSHVKWNPYYYTWGCGEDCSKYSIPKWYCPYCYDSDYSRGIHLSCGG